MVGIVKNMVLGVGCMFSWIGKGVEVVVFGEGGLLVEFVVVIIG